LSTHFKKLSFEWQTDFGSFLSTELSLLIVISYITSKTLKFQTKKSKHVTLLYRLCNLTK